MCRIASSLSVVVGRERVVTYRRLDERVVTRIVRRGARSHPRPADRCHVLLLQYRRVLLPP